MLSTSCLQVCTYVCVYHPKIRIVACIIQGRTLNDIHGDFLPPMNRGGRVRRMLTRPQDDSMAEGGSLCTLAFG